MLREQGPLLEAERRGRDWPLPHGEREENILIIWMLCLFHCLFIVESSNIINKEM